MVRFSCFLPHIPSSKPKKTVHLSDEAMHKSIEDSSRNQALYSGHLKAQGESALNSNGNIVGSPNELDWKSEEFASKRNSGSDREFKYSGCLKKCMSLGSEIDRAGRVSIGDDSEEGTDLEYSCDDSQNAKRTVVPSGCNSPENRSLASDPLQVSREVNNSVFSIEDTQQSEQEARVSSDIPLSDESGRESCDPAPRNHSVIVKSKSLPNIGSLDGRPARRHLAPLSRSCEDITRLDVGQKEMMIRELEGAVWTDQGRHGTVVNNEESKFCGSPTEDAYDSYNYVGSAKDWVLPIMDEEKHFHGESSAQASPPKDFKIKRIQDWVIDLQYCSPPEEKDDELLLSDKIPEHRGASAVDNLVAARFDGKITPGMESVKKYLSSLSAAATTAHLANHGLIVIPFLSAYVSLKALNLSGNAIVRITAGALPRGLHTLNLSKNSISTIEGLRELTRLRVLDLSYNRIVRIGHGLASCSSLKELYLAGNKISEVEGLHRLLKLNVLDLRFNKLSTTKCLGQLAANYNSLQAISLEGNPAQKNVGDEQLKKYVQGLLPRLTYYNRQPIKAGILKDVSDRSTRLGMSGQLGGGRSERNLRKGSHGTASSIHSRRNLAAAASPKPSSSKGKNANLPPTTRGAKPPHRMNLNDFGTKLFTLRAPDINSIRRSRSAGNLAVI